MGVGSWRVVRGGARVGAAAVGAARSCLRAYPGLWYPRASGLLCSRARTFAARRLRAVVPVHLRARVLSPPDISARLHLRVLAPPHSRAAVPSRAGTSVLPRPPSAPPPCLRAPVLPCLRPLCLRAPAPPRLRVFAPPSPRSRASVPPSPAPPRSRTSPPPSPRALAPPSSCPPEPSHPPSRTRASAVPPCPVLPHSRAPHSRASALPCPRVFALSHPRRPRAHTLPRSRALRVAAPPRTRAPVLPCLRVLAPSRFRVPVPPCSRAPHSRAFTPPRRAPRCFHAPAPRCLCALVPRIPAGEGALEVRVAGRGFGFAGGGAVLTGGSRGPCGDHGRRHQARGHDCGPVCGRTRLDRALGFCRSDHPHGSGVRAKVSYLAHIVVLGAPLGRAMACAVRAGLTPGVSSAARVAQPLSRLAAQRLSASVTRSWRRERSSRYPEPRCPAAPVAMPSSPSVSAPAARSPSSTPGAPPLASTPTSPGTSPASSPSTGGRRVHHRRLRA